MLVEVKKDLHNEFYRYLEEGVEFPQYYPGMKVLSSDLYKKQLKEAIAIIKKEGEVEVSSFELYLDTIIVNMHTKLKKYKKSIYFDNENIKDIQNQGFTIPFFIDEKKETCVLLGIVNSQSIV